jgi:hypothetical protein
MLSRYFSSTSVRTHNIITPYKDFDDEPGYKIYVGETSVLPAGKITPVNTHIAVKDDCPVKYFNIINPINKYHLNNGISVINTIHSTKQTESIIIYLHNTTNEDYVLNQIQALPIAILQPCNILY